MASLITKRWRTAAQLAALGATILLLAYSPPAKAAPGDLSYVACVGNLSGCAPTNPAGALNGVRAVAMTPNGRHLYSVGSSGVSHFLIDATGNYTFAGCVGNLAGCTATNPATALVSGAVAGMTVSTDGRNLYVATQNAVSHLTLDTAGNATFAGCIGALAGCTATNPASAISGAVGIAFAPGHLYVSSINTNNVSRFTTTGTGGLVFAGCVGNLAGCTALAVTGAVDSSYGIALSPDRGHLYATSFGGNVTHFTVGGTGALSFAGCIGSRAGCAPTTPAGALGGPTGLAFGPDGANLYAASFSAGTVSRLVIDGAGNPSLNGCIGGAADCAASNPAGALAGAFRVALTPDGKQLYAVSQNSNAASHFNLDGGGLPSFANCSGSLAGCSPIAPADALTNAFGVAVRPDGSQLYVASFGANAVSRFSIEPPPAPTAQPTPEPTPVPPVVIAAGGIDGDGDGFFAGQDCNDSNRAIRPGAVEVKGNRIDENCDGFAEPFPTLAAGVATSWDAKGNRITLKTLQVTQQFPKGWSAKIMCKGKKCPFKTKKLKKGKVKRSASNVITSLSKKQRKFRAGQTVEVWISAPNFNTKVSRYALKKGKIPTTQPFCVLPGQTRPQKTCS
jgi:DNA-binding beta-propeller fold protein YncE